MQAKIMQSIHSLFNISRISNRNPEFFHNQAIAIWNAREKNKKIIHSITKTTTLEWEKQLKTNIWDLELKAHNEKLALKYGIKKRKLFIKISPLSQNEMLWKWEILDGPLEKLKLIADICNIQKIDGIIATNTAKEHPHKTKIVSASWETISWWASGKIIQNISLKTVQELRKVLDKDIPIIWVWGIGFDKKWEEWQSALNMMNAWAQTIQLYSSFIHNVMTPYNIKKRLLETL